MEGMLTVFAVCMVLFTLLSLYTNIILASEKLTKFLYVLIPIQLSLAAFGYKLYNEVQGYATTDISQLLNEEEPFVFVTYFMNGNDLYLIAYPYGRIEPRFFVFKGDSEGDLKTNRKLLSQLQNLSKDLKETDIVFGHIDISDGYDFEFLKRTFQETHPKE